MTVFPSVPPITDILPIAIRAYATPTWQELPDRAAPKPKARRSSKISSSPWALIFDCETTSDAGQALRFGTYQLRKSGELDEAGIFYDPDGVTSPELELLQTYAAANAQTLRTRQSFVDEVFFARAYQFRATIIGLNLPFDISRLAIAHGTARTPLAADTHAMRGAFTFKLSGQKIYPNIRIKHMSSRAALISFAAPMGQPDSRGQRKRGLHRGVRRGHFIDVKTLASALFAKSFSLASLSKFLAVPNPKLEFDDFDGPITDVMVRYAVRDVQTTWECYSALIERFGALKLTQSIAEKIYSEASIGKAYLKEMGILPWRKVQPDAPASLIGTIMGTYFGGRSEVRIRREIRQVILCDFLSMYPTVCTLMGLWRFAIADGMVWQDATENARELLGKIDLPSLQAQSTWAGLAMLVQVKPDADIFPVRAAYKGEGQATIGANFLTSQSPQWFTLADCIASKLLTGKTPKIIEALSFSPGAVQSDLRPVDIAGNPAYRVDPNTTDFFKRVIELRQSIKCQIRGAKGDERARLDTEQNSLKICANSTSYGIWVEVNVETKAKSGLVSVLSSTSAPFSFQTDKAEMPGTFFHPLLATLITGAARLMLALAERLASDEGLDWSFCDTDSMAFAKPDAMRPEEFAIRTNRIVDWFSPLNPYEFGGSILKVEDVNGSLETGEPEPLYCYAISSKRYALFNLAADGSPIMRKISAHGLGHLIAPYGGADAPEHFPTPNKSVLRDGTARWHSDLWHQIVSATIAGNPDQVSRDYHPAFDQPAISRYAATSPDMLRWFKAYNASRSYRDQVKPFNFLLSMTPAWGAAFACDVKLHSGPRKGRPKAAKPIKPVSPFETDPASAMAKAFDRETGLPIAPKALRTLKEALAQYHISPESKFLNGDYLHRNTTQRRHVKAALVQHIGKEAHDWERQAMLGIDSKARPDYGLADESVVQLRTELARLADMLGNAGASKVLGVATRKLRAILSGKAALDHGLLRILSDRLPETTRAYANVAQIQQGELELLRQSTQSCGLRKTARRLGVDPSNLRRKIIKKSQATIFQNRPR